jgi:hypothetical protein
VNYAVCEVALSKGHWARCPHPGRVRKKLRRVFGDSLLGATFREPGSENLIEAEVRVCARMTCERVSDIIFRAFLGWKPEYESMIEVEILRANEGVFDAPSEPAEDDEDEWYGFDQVERVWR